MYDISRQKLSRHRNDTHISYGNHDKIIQSETTTCKSTQDQVCVLNLRNRDAQREQHFTRNGTLYGNTSVSWCPPWQNICKTKQKVNARKSIIRKLASSNWGSRALTLRSIGLALCYSTADNTCVVWARSTQAKKLNPALHDCCRITTGCLKPTT